MNTEHETELVWYEDGKVYTQREYLQREWQRAVSEDEALQYVRRKKFVESFIKYAELKNK